VKKRVIALLLAMGLAIALAACREGGAKADEPVVAVHKLLALHDLEGKTPRERTEESRDREVERGTLREFIADMDDHDPFIADIYLGFVLGVLSSNQSKLFVEREGARATVHAGRARVAMRLVDGEWKIVLSESVPDEIKERSAVEKKNFDEAKARAKALR